MKKLFSVFIAAILSCFLISCQKESIDPKLQKLSHSKLLSQLKNAYEKSGQTSSGLEVAGHQIKPAQPDWNQVYVKGNHFLIATDTASRRVNQKFIVHKYLLATYAKGEFSFTYRYLVQDKQKIAGSLHLSQVFDACFDYPDLSLKEGSPFSVADQKYPGQSLQKSLAGNYVEATIPQTTLSRKGANTPPVQTDYAPVACPAECTGTCINIDWYYQEYDIDGNLIYEEYLFTTAECMDGGGGGSNSPSPNEICQAHALAFASQGNSVSDPFSSYTEETSLQKTVYDNWKIYQAGTWGILSYEKVIFTRPNMRSGWIFSEYTHLGDASVGQVYGGTRTYNIISKEVINNWIIKIQIRIDYTVTSTPVCSNIPLTPFPSWTLPFNANRIISAGPMTIIP
ncbi:MAG: hypothetical protein QM687_04685 [Ferruginibacter sp.]